MLHAFEEDSLNIQKGHQENRVVENEKSELSTIETGRSLEPSARETMTLARIVEQSVLISLDQVVGWRVRLHRDPD